MTVNGKETIIVHNTLKAQRIVTSPEGRSATSLYDPNTLLVESISVPGLHLTTYGYNSRGRLTSISANNKHRVEQQHPHGAQKTPLVRDSGKNKIVVTVRQKIIFYIYYRRIS